MPAPGGAADKFGNRYEALWSIDQLLQVVYGSVRDLTLEPLNVDESKGVEFSVNTVDGITEYWSVKRQTTGASGWTLAQLNSQGRSWKEYPRRPARSYGRWYDSSRSVRFQSGSPRPR